MLNGGDIIQRISADLAMLPSHVVKIIKTAPLRYKVFEVPKKSGGFREIAQPAREVKLIQYWVIKNLENLLPVHSSASAYRSGASIKANAEAHVSSRYMLKLDFNNFFPSILFSDIKFHIDKYCSEFLDPSASSVVAHVCCWAKDRAIPLRLCIGAPSSPLISNSIMFDFDKRLHEIAREKDVVYTRYADDITLSSRERGRVEEFVGIVASLLMELEYPRLSLNKAKTVLASRAGKRVVTGLILTPDGRVSIGRERKRFIRAMYHRSLAGLLSDDESEQLMGLISFADDIEPGFSTRLKGIREPES